MAKYYRSVRVLQGSDGPSAEGSTDKGYHVSESKSTPTMGAQDSPEAIYDARKLGKPKMAVFGLQHMFAMFGATILVPTLTGLSVSATLLFAGVGTLLFHFISKGKVPAFLGSSFAFIAGYAAIAPNGEADLLPYACLGVACAGLLYLVLSALFKVFGPTRVMRFFPPVVTGPIVISIGLILASSAITNASTNWPSALVAIAIIVIAIRMVIAQDTNHVAPIIQSIATITLTDQAKHQEIVILKENQSESPTGIEINYTAYMILQISILDNAKNGITRPNVKIAKILIISLKFFTFLTEKCQIINCYRLFDFLFVVMVYFGS